MVEAVVEAVDMVVVMAVVPAVVVEEGGPGVKTVTL